MAVVMYAELHTASAFSFLEGASVPEDLVEEAARLEYSALALCDRDGVSGAPRFYKAAKAAGIKPIVGCEVSLENNRRLTLLIENQRGYQNLCRMLTRVHLRAEKGAGRASWADLEAHAGGWVGLIDDLRDGDPILGLLGPRNVYVEIQRHFREEQEEANQARMEFARRRGLPLLATNGVRYATAEKRRLYDALSCLRHKTTLDSAGRLLDVNAERRLKDRRAMARLFHDIPEAIWNSSELAQRLDFTLDNLGYEFPRYPLPPGETPTSFLRQMTLRGAQDRYGRSPLREKAYRQIDHELNVIAKLELEGYFLIVWDIVQFTKRNNILCQGRGSAANSAVCYALGITAVDPVAMDLLFERFLSEERCDWPDIDIDLPSGDDREKAIQYVYSRYGRQGAGMTATVISYRDKSAVRDMAKALSFSEDSIQRLSKCIHYSDEDNPKRTAEQIRMAGFDPNQPRFQELVRLCGDVLDLPHHLSQHPGGLVVCQGALDSVVPLENARMADRRIVQWDKEDCADLGLVKVDLLGLGMLNALKESVILLNQRGINFDIAHIPPDDEKTYRMIQAADTVGVFQIESRAQMATLPRMRPARFYDLVVQIAIIRPGPIAGDMAHPFLRRRMGREPVTYPHPCLEPLLKRTLGVPLFQEQLLRMAMVAAGFTGGEAEQLRRAIGFKRSTERMKVIERKLRLGLNNNGIRGAAEEQIVRAISSFALFGFPESHSASFALLAYASAYLKAHYPATLYVGLLNAQPMGFYSPATLVKDAQRHGIRVRPIDVVFSEERCTVETDERFRIGLNYVSGLSAAGRERILQQRRRAPFRSIDDFTHRTGLPKADLDTLAKIGALNSLGEDLHRREALWQIEKAYRPRGPLLEPLEEASEASGFEPMSPNERLAADYDGASLTTGPHPMHYQRPLLLEQGVTAAADLEQCVNGSTVYVAGVVITRQRPMTAKGFVFLSLEDETGVSNIVVLPDMFQKTRALWSAEPALIVCGRVQKQDGVIHVRAENADPLDMTATAPGSHDFH